MPRATRKRNVFTNMRRASIEHSELRESSQNRVLSPDGPEVHPQIIVDETELTTRINALESLVKILSEKRQENFRSNGTFKIDCIPEFEPGSINLPVSLWLRKIDQIGEIHSWNDGQKIFAMQNRLKGLARIWFENLNEYVSTWEEWKSVLCKSFPVHQDFSENLKRLMKRVKLPSESMTNYYFEKKTLADTCKIFGNDAVSCIIDGLPSGSIQVSARAGRFQTPEDLFGHYLSTFPHDMEMLNRWTYHLLN